MPQENILVNDIITDHRERMLNLKKYYPFFKLSEVSFSWYREGMYDSLEHGVYSHGGTAAFLLRKTISRRGTSHIRNMPPL